MSGVSAPTWSKDGAPPSSGPDGSSPPAALHQGRTPLLFPGTLVMMVAVIGCFTAWGIAADLTTPMVAGFKRIFDMNSFQASLVQMAYYGAYFLLALPAALLNDRWGYKVGLLTGLGLASLGAFAFLPGLPHDDLRGLPGGPLRDRRWLLHPGDLGEPLCHLAGPGGDRHPEIEPGPGLQTPWAPTSACSSPPR
ncbi:MAG: hypothetical protein L0K65_09410 [Actinomyces sp.]|nr:hypothetical protein [Actinomyces sp.]